MTSFEITQPPVHTRPLAAPALWERLVEAAGRQCECTGACGRTHAVSGGRCDALHDHHHDGHLQRLIVAPADLTLTERQAAAVAEGELRVWCPRCHGPAGRRARAAVEELRRRETTAPPALFDLT